MLRDRLWPAAAWEDRLSSWSCRARELGRWPSSVLVLRGVLSAQRRCVHRAAVRDRRVASVAADGRGHLPEVEQTTCTVSPSAVARIL